MADSLKRESGKALPNPELYPQLYTPLQAFDHLNVTAVRREGYRTWGKPEDLPLFTIQFMLRVKSKVGQSFRAVMHSRTFSSLHFLFIFSPEGNVFLPGIINFLNY